MINHIDRDDTILEKVVFGRIEPKIYAFETNTIPNYLKVGDTYRFVDERLDEWRKIGFSDLEHVGDWSAEIEGKDTYFRDYSVHNYLIGNGNDRLERDIYPDKPYSQEFFKNASKEDVEKAISDIVDSYESDSTRYVYYSIKDRVDIDKEYKRDAFEWKPREPLQTDAIDNFKKAQENGRSNLLMYAVMRFGKSFTSLCCAKAMNAKFVLVVSGKADVADEWQQNVQKPGQFDNFVFLNSKKLKRNDKAISEALASGKCIVLFLTLQDLSKEKKRFAELFKSKIDLMIIDETHFGARAETLGEVIKKAHYKEDTALKNLEKTDGIKNDTLGSLQVDKAEKELEKGTDGLDVKVKLHLSGTPYRILMGSEFEKEDIISFCQYSDIISEKEAWYTENIAGGKQEETKKEEWENPYYGFPNMIRFAFNLNESAMNKIKELEEEGYSYHLSALFAPQSIEKDDEGKYEKFVYENEVFDFLQSIDGAKYDKNVLGFLDNKRIKDGKLCRHIVMVMPYCASCDAMEKLIEDKKDQLKNLSEYEIINISGVNSQYTKIEEVKSKISSCEKEDKKTITLTVNRMLTGCTVPQWDTMIFLKDTASPQDYDQAIFRLQSQYVVEYEGKEIVNGKEVIKTIKKDMKPQTLLVDFNPQRMFYLQETKSRINNINTADGGNDESEARIKRDLEISPIIHISENKLVEVTPTDILKAVSEYSTNRGITEAASDIIVDENLMNIEDIKKIIDREFEIFLGKGFAEQAYSGDETNLDDEDIETVGSGDKKDSNKNSGTKEDDNELSEQKTDVKVFVNKCRSYYRRILFYAFLCKSNTEIKNLTEVIESIKNYENQRIFDNLGMNEDFITLMKNNMSGTALRSLDNKIYDLYRLSHEYENEDDDPIRRATTAIQKFGKISDSEVVTPQKIAREMVDLIPEDDFKKVFENGNKFLDIASKMGEFAVAIYRRAESLGISKNKIENSIYSISTSKIAYEFTKYVYEKLDLKVENIASKFTSYSLLKFEDEEDNIGYIKIANLLRQNKPFDSITMADEITEGDDIVNFDIVVGNPPYQENVSKAKGNRSLGKQLFPSFVKIATSLSEKYTSLITPSKWFTSEGQDGSFAPLRAYAKENNHFKTICNFADNSSIFDGVSIGAVNYFLFDKDYNGNVLFKSDSSEVERPLFEDGMDIILSMEQMVGIVNKVRKYNNFVSFMSLTCGRDAFGISGKREYLENNTSEAPFEGCVSVRCAYEKIRYIDKEKISKNLSIVEHWKVFTSKGNGAAGTLDLNSSNSIIGKAYVGEPNSACSDSLIPIGSFETESEAINLSKYMATKFLRFMVGIMKSSRNIYQVVYRFVPLQNFTNSSDIDWSKNIAEIDLQLYKKYGLSTEEITFIESTIKPME